MEKNAFAVRLRKALQERDMTPSDLARKLYGELEVERIDKRGNPYITKEARWRHKVKQWVDGTRNPVPTSKMEIAKELRMPVTDLDPSMADQPIGYVISPVDSEGMVNLNIAMRVPGNIGRAVGELLRPWIGRA